MRRRKHWGYLMLTLSLLFGPLSLLLVLSSISVEPVGIRSYPLLTSGILVMVAGGLLCVKGGELAGVELL